MKIRCYTFFGLIALACGSLRAADRVPHWIWSSDTATAARSGETPGRCDLQQTFALDQQVRSATLRFAADFCDATVHINDRGALTLAAYSPATQVDVANLLKAGDNRLAIAAIPVGGPTAVALSLSITLADGSEQTIVSDEQWKIESSGQTASPAVSLGQVTPQLWGLGRRSIQIDPFDNYEQWRQAIGADAGQQAATFWVAPGFEIALVRTAGPDEGSWVSMAFDPAGRLTIAREDKGLLRLTLAADRQSVERMEMIDGDLLECRGLLYAHGALYANANNSKGLYRLRDTDGDDSLDEVKCLRQFPGGVGHGRNDLALGPDGLIYSIHGDSVELPAGDIFDLTSPLREARRGQKTSEGHVIRTDKDGQKFELLAAGLRNPFGIALNHRGDMFTYDADAEFDMGTPWYRPTRIIQIVPGSDYGWRGVTGKWPPYFADHPDNAPPTLDIGKGSPTAVAFAPQAHFPADYRQALFVLDWTYGRILAVHLAPRGAGYRAQAETFVKGRPFNVTDLAVGPDGALYVVTGGRKTQSALYRISYTKDDWQYEPKLSSHEAAGERFAEVQRQKLQRLSAMQQPHKLKDIQLDLSSPDPLVRHAAQTAWERSGGHLSIETRSVSEGRLNDPSLTLRVSLGTITAHARTEDPAALADVVSRLAELPLRDLNVQQSLLLLHCYSLALQHAPAAIDRHKEQIARQLDAAYPHPTAAWLHVSRSGTGAHVQRELARLLAALDSPTAVSKISQTLLVSPVQEDRLQALFALRNTRQGWNPETRREYFRVLNERAHLVSGEGMPKFLAHIKDEAVATLTEDERQALAAFVDPKETVQSEPLPPPRPVVKQWTLDDFEPLLADAGRGSAERGASVFQGALCVRCHRVGARGPAVGPDLTHVAGRFSRRDMLAHILDPALVVAENYRNVQVRTTDGRTIVGRVVVAGDYRSQELQIATDPLAPSTVVKLHKSDVEEYRESETSPMPRGLLDTFRQEEVLDLLAFLEGGAR
jgi:putative heme-binding domain-containing protein